MKKWAPRVLIAAALAVNGLCFMAPAGNDLGIGPVSASAYTYSGASKGELTSLNVYRSSGSELELRSSYYGKEVELSSKKDYYIDLKNGGDEINLDAEVKGDGYIMKVFTSGAKDAKAYDIDDSFHIDASGTNIYIRTYESEDDFHDADDDEDVTKCKKTYVLHVRRDTNGKVSDEELLGDEAALRSIYLSDGTIDFDKKIGSYNVNVGEDVEELTVRAKPDNSSNTVEINGDRVDDEDNYEAVISLDKGDNLIEIKVTNDDEDYYNVYTLNVYRGKVEGDSSSYKANYNGVNQIQAVNWSFNSWQQVDGKWQYIDGTGQPLKDKFWFDSKNGKTYYLGKDGYRVSGWMTKDGKWYYFNEIGEMQTGWLEKDGHWYYLNRAGIMVSGWSDISNKWYYFKEKGEMQTGWLQVSNGNWYYLNASGEMVTSTTVDGYEIDKKGIMVEK